MTGLLKSDVLDQKKKKANISQVTVNTTLHILFCGVNSSNSMSLRTNDKDRWKRVPVWLVWMCGQDMG